MTYIPTTTTDGVNINVNSNSSNTLTISGNYTIPEHTMFDWLQVMTIIEDLAADTNTDPELLLLLIQDAHTQGSAIMVDLTRTQKITIPSVPYVPYEPYRPYQPYDYPRVWYSSVGNVIPCTYTS